MSKIFCNNHRRTVCDMKKWYVLHVATGAELEVQRHLKSCGIDAVVLQEMVCLRRQGSWHYETRTLFPGYVFLYIHFTAQMFHVLKRTPGAYRVLPKDKPMPMQPKDSIWLIMMAGEDVITPSKVDFSGDVPVVIEGPLKELEQYIVKYNRRQRRVSLNIPVLGERKNITLSILPV